MSELSLNTAVISFTPEEAAVGDTIGIQGSGFLVNELVDIQVVLPEGSQFFTSILTDAGGSFSSEEQALPASVRLVSTGVFPALDDTVTIDGVVYTFKDTVDTEANEIVRGPYALSALSNLAGALQLGLGEYGSETEVHPTVEPGILTEESLVLLARVAGTDGNALAVSESSDQLSFESDTLLGGQEATQRILISFGAARPGVTTVTASDGVNTIAEELKVWSGA